MFKAKTILIYIVIFVIGFFATYQGLKFVRKYSGEAVAISKPTPNAYALATAKPVDQVEPVKQAKGTYNILLLGHGGTGHAGGLLTDSLIVLHVDTNIKKATFISVPRDLWVTGNKKINSVGISGYQNTMPVVSGVTGLPMNYFVAVDFGGFSKLIDALGGITANTPNTFDDPFYPISGEENNLCGKTEAEVNELKAKYSGYNLETQFTCRYEHLHFDKGPAKLDGKTALKYVRSRHGDSDFGRSARQFAVLVGIADKLITFQAAQKFDEIVGTLLQIVKTDLDAGTIKSLVGVIGDTKSYTTNQIGLTTDNVLVTGTSSDKQFILTPKAGNFNFDDIHKYINSNIN